MFTFLLVVQALIAAILVGVILMQQSEGGGLGMGGSPSGLMSARGAANFLTRATGILAVSFVTLSIVLAVVATQKAAPTTIDTSLAKQPLSAAPAPAPAVPLSTDPEAQTVPAPVAGNAPMPVVPMAAPVAAPKPEAVRKTVPSAAAPKPVATTPTAPAPAPAIKVVPTRTLPPPLVSNQPTPAPVGPPVENK